MRTLPTWYVVACFFTALVFPGIVHTQTYSKDEDPLWMKAVRIAAENDNWVPGFVIHYEEVYSRIGIRNETTETHSSLQRHTGKNVEAVFKKVIQNGKDITDEFKEEFYESIILEEQEYRVEHPFRVSTQELTNYRQLHKKKVIDGKRCVLYEFTYHNVKGKWKGEAWLDENTGIPVRVEGTLQSVPLEETWYIISSLEVKTAFTSTSNGDWYPQEVIVDSHIEVGDKLFRTYKSRVKETYRLSEYWRYE
jgi:hypothetical protein